MIFRKALKKLREKKLLNNKATKIAIASILIIIFIIGIVFSVIYSLRICDKLFVEQYEDVFGVLCQIVISLIACIVSILGIAISIQNDEIYAVPIRRFNKIRKGLRFSILQIVVISLVLSIIGITMFALKLYLTCAYFLTMLVLFCTVACFCEIPFMCKNEKAIFNAINKSLEIAIVEQRELASDLKTIIKNLITGESSLKNTYLRFARKNDAEYNKYLLLKLLELQCDYSFELSQLDDNEKSKKSERLVVNIKDVLSFKDDFDAMSITQNDLWSYQHLITRVLFRTSEILGSNKKTMHLIYDTLPFLEGYSNKYHEKFMLSIAIRMTSASIANGDLSFLNELKRVCSSWQYTFAKGGALTTIFAISSVHLYYLCTSARNVTQEFKERIIKFIQSSPIIDSIQTSSWSDLYGCFLQDFRLNISEFLHYFNENENNWDMRIYDAHAHFVVMDIRYALTWFLANLFSSYTVMTYDYKGLLSIDTSYHKILQNIGDEILKNSKAKEEMLESIKFFNKKEEFHFFNMSEERTHRFANFISDLHKKSLYETIENASNVDINQLSKNYREKLEASLKQEWGYNDTIDTKDISPQYLKIIVEKKSEAINYEEVLSSYLIEQSKLKIDSDINKKVIKKSELTSVLESIKGNKKIYATESMRYEIGRTMMEKGGASCITYVKSTILSGYNIIVGGELSFGFNANLSIKELNRSQIAEKAEEYKTQDGHYIYDGAFLNREETEECVEKQYALLELELTYKLNMDGIEIYKISYFDDEE